MFLIVVVISLSHSLAFFLPRFLAPSLAFVPWVLELAEFADLTEHDAKLHLINLFASMDNGLDHDGGVNHTVLSAFHFHCAQLLAAHTRSRA